MQGLQWSLWHVRAALKLFSNFCAELITKPLIILDLYEYNVYFASAWLQRNSEGLILAVKPHLITGSNDHVPSEANENNLNKLLCQIAESLAHNRSTESLAAAQTSRLTHHEQAADMKPLIPVDERWQIIRASLWGFMSGFLKHQTDSLLEKLEDNYSFHPPHELFSIMSNCTRSYCEADNLKKQIELIFVLLAKPIKMTSEHISSYCATRFASFLLQKIGDRSSPPTLQWLEEFSKSQLTVHYKNLGQGIPHLSMTNNDNELSAFECLWDFVTDPKVLSGVLALEHSKWWQYLKQKHSRGWSDECTHGTEEFEGEENCDQDDRPAKNSPSNAVASPRSPDSPSVVSSGSKGSTTKMKFVPYQNPKEIYKRNGELLEALCINSTDQKQAAIASNKKGIIFFSWEDGLPSIDKSDYIWTEVDWPHDGWAGSESIPVPTCVSPGVGLGKKKGTHLGLGGATVGVDSFARPGRDFTGGGAFGIPGYAGVGASGLGWETQEDFEDFVDPPATLENVRTRAFSSHPSRPFFLVGSSNTHIYLWEFGKGRAIATYGVLPAANVPPPYALASISAVQFDQCGQRFATAASDGTVCTWQLEVGGRSNIHPTESSLCFNNYTTDVTYVTASGSIIASTGYSSNNVNVVIWDTLAPPTTSRASIMCHEGGARSLSVFANDVGSGSISPLIVTGGKGGDVGVHDFRYIATGRTKRHRNSDSVEQKINASSTAGMQSKHGDQNRNGMLWYIPKAHSESVTRISAIPNTSFFLTGSKDGDVKLWDAKRAKLVFHWPKLHDRHTFLQPNSRGFGGVVRAAVTDIQVVSHGFISCGGDGSVKLVQLKGFLQGL